jgi:short-subunit dehydrogenase
MDFAKKYGPTALIAGGSEGVGASYARLLAERGLDLVLLARNTAPLALTRIALQRQFPDRKIESAALDLTAPDMLDKVRAVTAGKEIGLLICNAGSCERNEDFVDNDLGFAQRLATLNVMAPMALAHEFGRAMKARGRGGIVLMGSFAALAGSPTLAVYSAAKAFSATFCEALWHELAPFGVDVLHHQLGSTDTPFIARHYPQQVGKGDNPDTVAAAGVSGIGDGPLLRSPGGAEFAAYLNSMSRADAVRAAYEAGKAFMAG